MTQSAFRDFSIKIPLRTPLRQSLGTKKPWKPKQKAFLVVSSRLKEKSPNTIHSERPIVYQIPVSITFHSNHFVSYAIALARLFGHDIFIARFWKSTFNEIWGVWQIIKSEFRRRMPEILVALAGFLAHSPLNCSYLPLREGRREEYSFIRASCWKIKTTSRFLIH